MRHATVRHAGVCAGAFAAVLWIWPAASIVSARPAADRPASSEAFVVAFRSQPEPSLNVGENTFEVNVRDASGRAVGDLHVSVRLEQTAWPIKRLAATTHTIELQPADVGTYRGSVLIASDGAWHLTIRADQGGRRVATRALTLYAQ
ncbi:MAG TPA: FixH family protein [Vicinamibacterales bacterium]|nr:FixH family protein [Vicinamibacterales bacterium]